MDSSRATVHIAIDSFFAINRFDSDFCCARIKSVIFTFSVVSAYGNVSIIDLKLAFPFGILAINTIGINPNGFASGWIIKNSILTVINNDFAVFIKRQSVWSK